MQLLPIPHMPSSPRSGAAPTPGADPQPPARWLRWWTSPIASVSYGPDSSATLWHEALIPARRTLTGAREVELVFGGHSVETAITAARLLAEQPVDVTFSDRSGRSHSMQVNPAIAVLRDAEAGAYWLAPLQTTVQHGEDWIDAPHAIDGPAFEGAAAVLQAPTVQSATPDMVAVVGRTSIQRPTHWTTAPDDSILDRF